MPSSMRVQVVGERGGYWYVRPVEGQHRASVVSACGLRKGHEIPASLCHTGATGIASYVTRSNGGRWEVREDATRGA